MFEDNLKELKERIPKLPDEVLLKMVNTERAWHSTVEIAFAEDELEMRGFVLVQTGPDFAVITPNGTKLCAGKSIVDASATTVPPNSADFTGRIDYQTSVFDKSVEGRTNWLRILKYTLMLYAVTFVVGFVFGFIASTYARTMEEVPLWIQAIGYLIMSAVTAAVFSVFSYRHQDRALVQGLLIAGVSALTSLPLNVLLFSQPFPQWVAGAIFMGFLALMGISIGLGLRARKEIAEFKSQPLIH